mmetsp:Transcript_4476/g.10609  ORF Transcript_4476/g.10609 Transcript_4476/m.10609 type:complete len:217 (+) Transcript_4476:305-955(+)
MRLRKCFSNLLGDNGDRSGWRVLILRGAEVGNANGSASHSEDGLGDENDARCTGRPGSGHVASLATAGHCIGQEIGDVGDRSQEIQDVSSTALLSHNSRLHRWGAPLGTVHQSHHCSAQEEHGLEDVDHAEGHASAVGVQGVGPRVGLLLHVQPLGRDQGREVLLRRGTSGEDGPVRPSREEGGLCSDSVSSGLRLLPPSVAVGDGGTDTCRKHLQ